MAVRSHFGDGDPHVQIPENLRRRDVVIFSSGGLGVNSQAAMETFFIIDAAQRAGASDITAVFPYAPFFRGDKKSRPREPIQARVFLKLLQTSGANRFMTVDAHSAQCAGFFDGGTDFLEARKLLSRAIAHYAMNDSALIESGSNFDPREATIMGPDKGSAGLTDSYSRILGARYRAQGIKTRDFDSENVSNVGEIMGTTEGRYTVLVDDIGDSLGTLTTAAELAMRHGSRGVLAVVTHGIFSRDALQRLDDSPISLCITTDTVDLREEVRNHPKIRVVSVAPLLADAVYRNHVGASLSRSSAQF